MKKQWGKLAFVAALATVLISTSVFVGQTAVSQSTGVAVAQYRPSTTTSVRWNPVQDGAMGDDLKSGIMAVAMYTYDDVTGNWDRVRGRSVSNGFFSILKTNLSTLSSNQAFGFTSKHVMVTTASGNTANVCIDWLGGTAVCPAVNTAGDDVLTAGESIQLDNVRVTSISAIAASGTQTVTIRAWN